MEASWLVGSCSDELRNGEEVVKSLKAAPIVQSLRSNLALILCWRVSRFWRVLGPATSCSVEPAAAAAAGGVDCRAASMLAIKARVFGSTGASEVVGWW